MIRRIQLISVLAAGLALAWLPTPAAGAEDVCGACHEDTVAAFSRTVHGRQFASDAGAEARSCSSCHANAGQHAESGGETAASNPGKATAADANAACLTCHESNPEQASWHGSAHDRAGARCVTCHDVHNDMAGTPQMAAGMPKASASTQKCLTCHGAQRQSLHQRSRHPIDEGQMECASCHNPHGSPGEHLIDQASVNDLCFSCHQNLRGPFLWEHSPVREDCLTCHRAHGSNYPSMLQARVTQLCQSCHQQGRHQTIAGVPASMWTSNRACLNCHPQIHGSNHPSGPLFQR